MTAQQWTPHTAPTTDNLAAEDWAIPCEGPEHGKAVKSDQPAEWIVWGVICCDTQQPHKFGCDPCVQAYLRSTGIAVCACGVEYRPPRRSISRLEPIRGGVQ